MESEEKSAWISRTAAILNMTIPVKKRTPPLEYVKEDEADIRILPHIQIIFEFTKDLYPPTIGCPIQPITGLGFLFAYGSYYTPHPTSHEMFDLAIYLAQYSQSLFLELLVTCWGAAASFCRAPPCCSKSKRPILLALDSMPKNNQTSEPWLPDNQSSALNALYLRLAFIFELVRYEAKKGNGDYREPISWIIRYESTKTSRMGSVRVMLSWRPTSSLMGDLEEQACMLQDISNIAFWPALVKLRSLEKEERLVQCFDAFRTFSSLHEPVFAGLAKLSLMPGYPFNNSLEAIYRILTLSYKANILRVWKLIAKAVADISIRASNDREKLDVVKLFNYFKTREDSEKSKLRGKGEFVTDISDSKWARFCEFYHKFDITQAALVDVARTDILYFLRNPSNRDQALDQMSKLLSAQLDSAE
jgi:hypothetical protein